MLKIAKCESGLQQFNKKGETLISPTNDAGLFQINIKTWDNKAKELGLDYRNSVKDNTLMAKHVLDKQGLNAWTCYKKVV